VCRFYEAVILCCKLFTSLQESEEPKTEEPAVDSSQKSEDATSQSKVGHHEVVNSLIELLFRSMCFSAHILQLHHMTLVIVDYF